MHQSTTIDRDNPPDVLVNVAGKVIPCRVTSRTGHSFATVDVPVGGQALPVEWSWPAIVRHLQTGRPLIF